MLLACATALPAQSRPAPREVSAAVDFVKEPGGVVLARLARGARVGVGAVRGSMQEVTLEGWVPVAALRADNREGFDFAVSRSAGVDVRVGAGTGSTVAMARAGALFTRRDTKGEWVRVERTGWVARSALAMVGAVAASPPTAPPASTPPQSPAPVSADSAGRVTIPGGTTLAAQPSGSPIGAIESPLRGEVMERRDGWAKVRFEAWVRDGALGSAPPANRITAEEVRSNPERYLGKTVEWTLQVLAVQKADELRPELPLGQPYILARGPLPETGFVYLVVRAGEVEQFRALEPLAEIRVRATVRAGQTRFLPTPVLDFVRRLD